MPLKKLQIHKTRLIDTLTVIHNYAYYLYSPQLTMLYFGNFTDVSQISPNFPQDIVQYTVRNMGPSTIFNASLTILLPVIVPNQQDRYYLYPFKITVCLL